MASSPASATPPTSSPTPPASSTLPPTTTTPSAPPPSNATVTPPTAPASAPPPATPSSPPPGTPSSPPPATPSAPPPAASSVPSPPPASPSLPSPPPNSSSSPPAQPFTGTPSPPSTRTHSPPSTGTPSPPSTGTPSPPSSGGSTPSSSSGDGGSSSLSTGLVVGIAVGGVMLLLLVTLFFICCKRKRKRDGQLGQYYGGSPLPPPRKDDGYGGQPQSWQHNAPPPAEHGIKIRPHLSPPPAHASRPPQFPPQPPPPPMFSSSGASGSNYSGSETPLPPPSPGISLGFSKSIFTFEELVRATDGFSDANLLGQGGFGYVHRGMLPNGKEVAVKQLKTGSGQGEREFQAEVEIISRVHHKHLVSLVGYCITGEKRLLVYEFVPNNTMEFHLHGKGRPILEWSTRLKIALGSAKGLAYLHEDCHPKIIHRDIKAANILLDFKFEAKVADFGLARFSADNNTHVSTRVMGTFGYLAPEYASSGKLTEKSDVFSYGVMLLELITGRRPVDTANTFMDDSLVDWARPILTRALEDHNYDTLVDPRLQHNYNPHDMAQTVACAAACVRHSARRRPRMSQIVRALEGEVSIDAFNEGVKPGHSTLYGSLGSSDYDSSQYNEDIKKFRKLALTSQEYASSEYSAATSEYGQNPSGSSSEAHTREMELARMKRDSGGFI